MKASAKNSLVDICDSMNKDINPYVQLLIDAQKENSLPLLYGSSLKKRFNAWVSFFQEKSSSSLNNNEIILEIGSHKGKVLSELANIETKKCFIGLDITFKRVVLAAQKLKRQNINNACVLLANARHLDSFIAPNELSGLIIFFPDPWLKKARQQHNRLIDRDFCLMMKTLLKNQSFFWFKTDSKEYFDVANNYLEEVGFKRQDDSFFPLGRNYVSTFEKNFHSKGIHTYCSCWYNIK